MPYEPEHLSRWNARDPAGGFSGNYGGADLSDWYIVVSRTRDADPLEISNFECAKKELEPLSTSIKCDCRCIWCDPMLPEHGAEYEHPIQHDMCDDCEEGEDSVADVHMGHWACGWYDMLMVHRTNEPALRRADELRAALNDYPVLDEEDFSEREEEDANLTWNNCFNLSERVDLCREYGVSIFAARHDYYPRDDNGGLFDYLRTP